MHNKNKNKSSFPGASLHGPRAGASPARNHAMRCERQRSVPSRKADLHELLKRKIEQSWSHLLANHRSLAYPASGQTATPRHRHCASDCSVWPGARWHKWDHPPAPAFHRCWGSGRWRPWLGSGHTWCRFLEARGILHHMRKRDLRGAHATVCICWSLSVVPPICQGL